MNMFFCVLTDTSVSDGTPPHVSALWHWQLPSGNQRYSGCYFIHCELEYVVSASRHLHVNTCFVIDERASAQCKELDLLISYCVIAWMQQWCLLAYCDLLIIFPIAFHVLNLTYTFHLRNKSDVKNSINQPGYYRQVYTCTCTIGSNHHTCIRPNYWWTKMLWPSSAILLDHGASVYYTFSSNSWSIGKRGVIYLSSWVIQSSCLYVYTYICRSIPYFCFQGYDMEDAMILNKASFERGFAHASVYKCEVSEAV